jgi:hypothetical protein
MYKLAACFISGLSALFSLISAVGSASEDKTTISNVYWQKLMDFQAKISYNVPVSFDAIVDGDAFFTVKNVYSKMHTTIDFEDDSIPDESDQSSSVDDIKKAQCADSSDAILAAVVFVVLLSTVVTGTSFIRISNDGPIVTAVCIGASALAAIFSTVAMAVYTNECFGAKSLEEDTDDIFSADDDDFDLGPGFVMQALSFILLTIACILHVFISFQK